MKLTSMRAEVRGVSAELTIELDGVHYEAVRFGIGTEAYDLVGALHRLAERIQRRASTGNAGVAEPRAQCISPSHADARE